MDSSLLFLFLLLPPSSSLSAYICMYIPNTHTNICLMETTYILYCIFLVLLIPYTLSHISCYCYWNSYVEILMPNAMASGCGDFGRWLCHKGRVFINGIYVLIKETPQRSCVPSAMWRYNKKSTTWKKELTWPCCPLTLDFQLLKLWERHSCCS